MRLVYDATPISLDNDATSTKAQISKVMVGSLACIHGLEVGDLICETGSVGSVLLDHRSFVELGFGVDRPLVIEVLCDCTRQRQPTQLVFGGGCVSPFAVSFSQLTHDSVDRQVQLALRYMRYIGILLVDEFDQALLLNQSHSNVLRVFHIFGCIISALGDEYRCTKVQLLETIRDQHQQGMIDELFRLRHDGIVCWKYLSYDKPNGEFDCIFDFGPSYTHIQNGDACITLLNGLYRKCIVACLDKSDDSDPDFDELMTLVMSHEEFHLQICLRQLCYLGIIKLENDVSQYSCHVILFVNMNQHTF